MCSARLLKCGLGKKLGMVVVLCVAAAILSPAQSLTTLANFTGANGANPASPVIQASDGNFYGTTLFGGGNACNNPSGCGTIFKLTPSGALTTIYQFCSQPNCADGFFPNAGLIQATDGNLYGTTDGNSLSSAPGTIFQLTLSGTLSTIYTFCSKPHCADGISPNGGIVQGNDGFFYGTTYRGGTGAGCPYTYGCGTAFKFSGPGLGATVTTLYNFCSQPNCADGNFPQAGLLEGTDGTYYGTTYSGGANCTTNGTCGTVFNVTPNGVFTLLHSFAGSDGANPNAALLQGVDGNYYGTTAGFSANNVPGTVFKITSSGALTTLYSFSGSSPQSPLAQAGDGNFYGTTGSPGATSTIYKITPGGMLTTIYTFCSLTNCADGNLSLAGVIQANDGNLYGTTYEGGSSNLGTVFRFTGPAAAPQQFVPVTPCRLVDTRGGSPIQAGTWQTFILPQLGNCGIPAMATSYSLNVTVVPPPGGHLGYLTIWPAGRTQPDVSTMNSPDGRTKANAAIVPAGANAAVSVFVTDTTDVILDIDGYFEPAISQTLNFFPLAPCRVVDTRQTNFPPGLGAPSFGTMEMRDLPIPTSPCLQGLPNQPLAYSFNVTAVPNPGGQPLGYLTIWPSNQQQPIVSTLNNPTATVVANAAIVQDAPNGHVSVFTENSTDVIIDINGYFSTPGGLSFYAAPPCRAYDSRNNNGLPFSGERTVNIVNSQCAPPSNAQAYVFNATVVPSPTLGYLTLWADGQTMPGVSTLNAYDGLITSNLAIVPNADGLTDAYAYGTTQLILDLFGYFAP